MKWCWSSLSLTTSLIFSPLLLRAALLSRTTSAIFCQGFIWNKRMTLVPSLKDSEQSFTLKGHIIFTKIYYIQEKLWKSLIEELSNLKCSLLKETFPEICTSSVTSALRRFPGRLQTRNCHAVHHSQPNLVGLSMWTTWKTNLAKNIQGESLTSSRGSWVAGSASWPTARLSLMMKSPGLYTWLYTRPSLQISSLIESSTCSEVSMFNSREVISSAKWKHKNIIESNYIINISITWLLTSCTSGGLKARWSFEPRSSRKPLASGWISLVSDWISLASG